MKYLKNLKINGYEIESIYKENRQYRIKLLNGNIIKIKDCFTISYICKHCGKEIIENVTPYKIRHYFSNDFSSLCKSCEQRLNPRVHVWTIEERKKRSEMYKGKNNPMYGKDWRVGKNEEELEAHRRHTSEGWYNLPESKKLEKINKCKATMNAKSDEEKFLIKEKIKRTWQKKTKEELIEIRKKQSLAQQKCMQNDPDYYKKIKARGGKASACNHKKYKINKIEQKVENWLKDNNIEYSYSCILNGKDGDNYQYDFIIHNKKILIEVNGTYWHADPRVYSTKNLNALQLSKIKRDKIKKEVAKLYGFTLLYIWEMDINNNDFSSLKGILNEN